MRSFLKVNRFDETKCPTLINCLNHLCHCYSQIL
jgi:hypothetical protein